MKKFCAKDIAKVLDKTVTFGIETLRPHILRYVRLQLFYLGYWIPLFMISRNDQITFVVHCKVMCLNLCYKRFRKEKISLEQSNGFLEFRLARSTLLFAPFPVDLRRGGVEVGGWVGVGLEQENMALPRLDWLPLILAHTFIRPFVSRNTWLAHKTIGI